MNVTTIPTASPTGRCRSRSWTPPWARRSCPWSTTAQKCATIEIHTRFHASASDGGLRAEAVVLSAGRRIVHLEAKTIDRVGRLIASATGSFAVVEPRSS
jgi:acyl-coenzyme A thioesterase PaaI-like protein